MKRKGTPGDWQAPKAPNAPAMISREMASVPGSEDVYAELRSNGGKGAYEKILEAIESGKAEVVDAILYCGRFDQDGMLLREAKGKPYRLVRVRGPRQYREAVRESARRWQNLPDRIKRARESARRLKVRLSKLNGKSVREDFFTSSSDLGSTYSPDPNQYTEFTPYFNGPFNKQQYFDYFIGHARAFEQSTHGIGKRIVDILCQYALGRGTKVRCKKDDIDKRWRQHARETRLFYKMRKFWGREYLTYGELMIDHQRMLSIDPSTIYDIVCEGYGEFIDQVLYYQQMFQTPTQMYAGIRVPGVSGSKDSKVGRYIIRQIPADQVIHIKTNVVSVEKRGRSVLFPVLGWIKRLTDVLNAQALGEQLRASFVWDDEIDGDANDVAVHAEKYNYIPVSPTLFVHNKAVVRKPLAPMAGINAGQSNIVQELLAYIAAVIGLPKEHLNVMMSGSGSRATAVVGSEPFTKVVEDLQEDMSDLVHRLIEKWCISEGIEYVENDWQVIFPSVVKDSTKDRLGNLAFIESQGWADCERVATMAAAELELDDYNYSDEMEKRAKNVKKKLSMGLPGVSAPPPPGRIGQPPADGQQKDNPIHGQGKKDIIKQHKNL